MLTGSTVKEYLTAQSVGRESNPTSSASIAAKDNRAIGLGD
jgi:hypothetical protein